jgi:NUBPL iron-transfer P-loop NTPase
MFFPGTPEEAVQAITNHEEAASMATIISIASGKGGVGKSVIAANLALLLAKKGRRVTLVDLDVGGADIHILFGLMNPPLTLTDFLNRRVERLEDIAQTLSVHPGLTLIPGTGDTLATANMPYAKKETSHSPSERPSDRRRPCRYRGWNKLSRVGFFLDGRPSCDRCHTRSHFGVGPLPVH